MRRRVHTLRWLVAIVVLAGVATRAHAAGAPDTERGRRFAVARNAAVSHGRYDLWPALFPTTLPCSYERWIDLGHRDMDSVWVRRFVAALPAAWDADNRIAACPPDTTSASQVRAVFGSGGDAVSLDLDFDRGTVSAWQDSLALGCAVLGAAGDRLLALLRESLPADSALSGLTACTWTDSGRRWFVPSRVDQLPVALYKKAPDYTELAREAGVSGTVLVQALIGPDGDVRATRIAESIPLLDPAAVRAVEQWTFRPARIGGRQTLVWVRIPVKFTLN